LKQDLFRVMVDYASGDGEGEDKYQQAAS
jgi:hypothetical protein